MHHYRKLKVGAQMPTTEIFTTAFGAIHSICKFVLFILQYTFLSCEDNELCYLWVKFSHILVGSNRSEVYIDTHSQPITVGQLQSNYPYLENQVAILVLVSRKSLTTLCK